MQPFAPFTEEQFHYLAMGKARAWTWDTLAQQLDMPIEIVERVAWTHEKLWNRALTKAERHVARETISEVAVLLRTDIRNVEPHLHAPLANSLTRVLKLQQEYAPPSRRRPTTPPVVTPTPAPITPTPAPEPAPRVGPSLGGTVASLLGFLVLLGALLMACWNRPSRTPDQTEFVNHEAVACLVAVEETRVVENTSAVGRIVLTPPPWVREHAST